MKYRLFAFLFMLLTGLAGCASPQEPINIRTHPRTKTSEVVVIKDPSPMIGAFGLALRQVSNASAPIVLRTRRPIVSATGALPEIQKVADLPILAVTEYKGWFWFATAVSRDSETDEIRTFISGYAVPRGGTGVSKWSVW
jgi:hypothetical protein